MSRNCHTCNLLLAGSIKLPPILLNMFAIKGLGSRYAPLKNEFVLTSLDLEVIKIKCATYTSAAAAITDDPNLYVSAAGKAAGPQAPIPKPTPAPTASVFTLPP